MFFVKYKKINTLQAKKGRVDQRFLPERENLGWKFSQVIVD